jgi:hypothetical protein
MNTTTITAVKQVEMAGTCNQPAAPHNHASTGDATHMEDDILMLPY